MTPHHGEAAGGYWQLHAPEVHQDQDPPVQNTWYPLLNTTDDVVLKIYMLEQHNDELAAKDMEVRITTVDETLASASTPLNNYVTYHVRRDRESSGLEIELAYINVDDFSGLICWGGALVEWRMTSVPGTNQNVNADIFYDTIEIIALTRWVNRVPATLDQDPPIQNTWYPILDTPNHVRVKEILTRQINDEVAAKDMEIRITVNRTVLPVAGAACADSTWYNAHRDSPGSVHYNPTISAVEASRKMHGPCHIEVRMTAVPGTNQELDGRVTYEELTL